jgi:mycothiol system anti-sigma-R factor
MADCNETLRELETFLDNELSPDAHGAIRAHLGGCPDCLQAFDFHAELKTVIAAKCRNDEMPPGLLDKLRSCFADDLVADHDRDLPAGGGSPLR